MALTGLRITTTRLPRTVAEFNSRVAAILAATPAASGPSVNAEDIVGGLLGDSHLSSAIVRTTDSRLSDARTPTTHSHAQADITNLVTDLAGKAATSHSHAQADVTNLVTDLAGKAAASHTHAQADVTNLVTDLAGKAASTHTHAATDIASGTVATARLGGGTANSSTFLRGDQTWATPAAGAGNGVDVTVDFGASFACCAATVVTGQAWVTGTSKIAVVVKAAAGKAAETALFGFMPVVSDLVNGTGFTLTVYTPIKARGTYTFSCIGV